MRQALLAAMLCVLNAVCADEDTGVFRQFFEAEDCVLTNLRTGRNSLGGYIGECFVFNIVESAWSGTLEAPLCRSIRPGRVRVFVRGYCSDGAPRSRTLTVRLGGSAQSVAYPDKDRHLASKHNWIPFELQLREAADRLTVEVSSSAGGRIIVDSILVSTDPADTTEVVKGRTRLVSRRHGRPARSGRAAGVGNMLVNAGFEVPPTNGWRSGYQSQWALNESVYDRSMAYEGRQCLRVQLMRNKRLPLQRIWQTYDGVHSAPLSLEPGTLYSASAYVRADGPVAGAIGLKGKSERFSLERPNEWQRVSASVAAPADVDSFFITFMCDDERTVWLDAAQLEQGVLSEYDPGPGVDVGLHCDRPTRIWREDDRVGLAWDLQSRSGHASVSVRYLIHDALGRVLRRDRIEPALDAGASRRLELHSGPHPSGSYRVAYTVESDDMIPYSGQLCYAVVPAARGDGPCGLYASHCRQCFAAMADAGLRWTNTLSSGGHFAEWTVVEPEKGRYVFHDADVQLAREFGIKFCANLNTNRNSMPGWVLREAPAEGEWVEHPKGHFRLQDWADFVSAMVGHYRDDVKHWLILDEPDGGTNRYSPEDYAKLLRSAHKAAKSADPECVVFGHTGTQERWHDQVLALAGPEHFEAQYTYIGRFNRATGERLRREAEEFGQPLWTVDFAPVRALADAYAEIDTEFPAFTWHAAALNSRTYGIWALRSLSWGRAEKWFRYDARYPGPPPGTSYMSIWEHDGTLTPHGASIAAMNALIGDARPMGEVQMPEGMEGHLFAGEGRKLLVAWTTDGSARHLQRADVTCFDLYGGRLATSVVGTLPVFVEFRGEWDEPTAPVMEQITGELLAPEGAGEPYRARFTAATRQKGGAGTWVADGPYFLERGSPQQTPCRLDEAGTAELVLPLNVWPNLPVSEREIEIRLFLPGRLLSGRLLTK